jgi:hypothetical protein
MLLTNDPHSSKRLSSDGASAEDRQQADAGDTATNAGHVQGEGDYVAAREFNEAERKFVASGKVAAAALAAAPESAAEQQEMLAAEEAGRRRAKEDDPVLLKPWPGSTTPGARTPISDR